MTYKFVWSHSAIVEFNQCPYKFYRKRVVKDVREEESEAMRVGNFVHKLFEDRINDGAPFPSEFSRYESYTKAIQKWPGETVAEAQLGITAAGQTTKFFADDVWGRGKIDVLNVDGGTARIADWKTGKKIKPDDSRAQFRTNCLLVFAASPEVHTVKGTWVYLNLGKVETFLAERTEVGAFGASVARVSNEVERAAETGVWAKRRSGLCNGWCPVTNCPHWAPKRKGQ